MELRPLRGLMAIAMLATAAAAAAGEIVLAGIVETRGPAAVPGTSFRQGYELALREINASGGVLGQTLVLKPLPIDTDESAARAAAQQAVALQPFAVLGPVFSGLTLATMPATAQARIPHFTGGEATSLTRQFHPTLLRTSLTQQEALPRLCAFAVYGLGARRLAVMWLDNEFGRRGREVLGTAATRRGAQLAWEERVPTKGADWPAIVQRLRQASAQALVLIMTEEESVQALTELRRQRVSLPILGDGPMVSTRVVEGAGAAADGVIGHTGASVDLPSPRMQAFVSAYEKAWGARPDHNSLKGYFAVQALRIALQEVGRVDAQAVLDHLKNQRLDGRRHPALMTASVRYDLFGDLDRESYILQARDGRMHLVATLSALDPQFATLPNGLSLPMTSDEFRRGVQAALRGDALPPPRPSR